MPRCLIVYFSQTGTTARVPSLAHVRIDPRDWSKAAAREAVAAQPDPEPDGVVEGAAR